MFSVGRLITIAASDTGAAAEIIERAYELLSGMELANLAVRGRKTPGVIGRSGVCVEASDAATRAALSLGIVASREGHNGHSLTSFAPLDQTPSEDDPILCMTWGQFNPKGFAGQGFTPYFGPRRSLVRRLGSSLYDYGVNYSAASVALRQTAHTPSSIYPNEHLWLKTTPGDIAVGNYPVGEVKAEDFPGMWEADLPVTL